MNSKVISIGVKVLIAVASGVAVYLGLSGCNGNKRPSNCNSSIQQCNDGSEQQQSFGESVSSGFHNIHETCGKVTNIIGSLAQVADSTRSLFGGETYVQQNMTRMVRINDVITTCGVGGNYDNNSNGEYPIFKSNKF